MVIISNLTIEITPQQADIVIKDCLFISLNYLQVKTSSAYTIGNEHFTLMGINIMGNSDFNQIILPVYGTIKLLYNETHTDRKHHVLTLNKCKIKAITIHMIQQSFMVTLKIVNIQFDYYYYYDYDDNNIISSENLGKNQVFLINCKIFWKTIFVSLFSFVSSSNGQIKFINCKFENSRETFWGLDYNLYQFKQRSVIHVYSHVNVEINNCTFHAHSKQTGTILWTHDNYSNKATQVLIKNTIFTSGTPSKFIFDIPPHTSFDLSHTHLQIEESVTFSNISSPGVISLKHNCSITITGSVEFSYNRVDKLIDFYYNDIKYIIMNENSVINIINNKVQTLFAIKPTLERYFYEFCLFQYLTSDSKVTVENRGKFLIRFYNNQCEEKSQSSCFDYMPITECRWLMQSIFTSSIPLEINNHYIQFINNSGTYKLSQIIEQSSLCVCTNELHYDCHINDLGYLYPGQTVNLLLYHKRINISNSDTATAVGVKTDINQHYITPCIALHVSENIQLADDKGCNKLHYTIGFPTKSYCELFLKIVSDSDAYLNVFYIRQITCPTGFVKIDKRCQCDPVLVQYGITNCNINDQTIPRSTNSWISATTHNNSYTYHISLHCPFHYCLPHSSHLNFSTPNSQCQFNRSGLLCGHCQQGLSTVFSSYDCQNCSSIYLLLIIPIAIAGVILVLLLFVLNLTVTDGTINGFILYANIISINTPVFFDELNHFEPTYTFISLANLDLGIQTCFYNGMDD